MGNFFHTKDREFFSKIFKPLFSSSPAAHAAESLTAFHGMTTASACASSPAWLVLPSSGLAEVWWASFRIHLWPFSLFHWTRWRRCWCWTGLGPAPPRSPGSSSGAVGLSPRTGAGRQAPVSEPVPAPPPASVWLRCYRWALQGPHEGCLNLLQKGNNHVNISQSYIKNFTHFNTDHGQVHRNYG